MISWEPTSPGVTWTVRLMFPDNADAMFTVKALPEVTKDEVTDPLLPRKLRFPAPEKYPAGVKTSCVVLKVNVPVRPLATMSLKRAMDD